MPCDFDGLVACVVAGVLWWRSQQSIAFIPASPLSKPTRLVRSTEPQFNRLSKCIEEDDDPTGKIALLRLRKVHSNGARNVMREALQAKSMEHSRNLLMHAAALGKERWFLALVREIAERVSVASMVMALFSYRLAPETGLVHGLVHGHGSLMPKLSAATPTTSPAFANLQ